MKTMKKNLLCCILAAMLTVACSHGAQLIVINQSNLPLTEVLVSGSGFSEPVGAIAPHAERRLLIRPRGESELQIRFNANGKSVSFGPEGYFEGTGGYVVTATVSPELTVSVKSELAY
jgi:hypothetical protein